MKPLARIIRPCRLLLILCLLIPQAMADPEAGKTVHIGVLAHRGNEYCLRSWTPMADYLSSRIAGYTFSIVPLSYEETTGAARDKSVDFMIVNPSIYIILEVDRNASAVATLKNLYRGKDTTWMGGVIFCRAGDGSINSIHDLKGKKIVATHPVSLGGWHAILYELHQAGIKPERDFRSIVYCGTHDQVVLDVLAGKADAGFVRTDVLERMADAGKISMAGIHVINKKSGDAGFPFLCSTSRYPEWPLVKMSHTSDDLAEKVACALIALPQSHPVIRQAESAGWSIPHNYQPVRDCLKELSLAPFDRPDFILDRFLEYYQYQLGISIFLFAIMALILFRLIQIRQRSNRDILEKKHNAERRIVEARLQNTEEQYHELFEHSPIPVWVQDYSAVRERLDVVRTGNIIDLSRYLDENPALEHELLSLIRVLDINKIARELFGNDGTAIPFDPVEKYYDVGGNGTFRSQLLSIWNGETRLKFETAAVLPSGETRDIIMYWHSMPGSETSLSRVRISMVDVTEMTITSSILRSRLHLSEYANSHTMDEILRETLDQGEKLTGSSIGFFHFLNDDQKTLSLQMWSTNTIATMCMAQGKGLHYPVEDAGVWVDCIHQGCPVIHNDYMALPHRKGLPQGHAPVIRELIIPVFRDNKIVAILGVGNRETPYGSRDIDVVSQLANMAWDIVMMKRYQEDREKILYDMGERIKEIRCLYESSDIARSSSSIGDILRQMVSILPRAWQFPEIASACIAIDGIAYSSGPWIDVPWRISSPVNAGGRERGKVELIYREERPGADEGPFLAEERNLIDTVARTIGEAIERIETEEKINRYQEHLEELVRERTSELSHSLSLLNATIDSTTDGIFVLGTDGEITAFNRRFIEMWDIPPAVLADGGDIPGLYRIMNMLLKEDCMFHPDITNHIPEDRAGNPETLFFRDGRIIECYVRPQMQGESIIGRVLSFRDVTERRKFEKDLLTAKEAAIAANEAKSIFLANMSHEIRTPMNAILGLIRLMLKTELTSQQADYLEKIDSSARSLLDIINDILDLSKIEAGRLALETVEFNLEEIMESVIFMISLKSRQKGIDLIFDYGSDVPLYLLGDPVRLRQIMLNLTNNSVKFTEEGEIIISVRVEERIDDNITLRFTVSDTGIGMSPEQVEKLFKPFTQADSSTTRKFGGTGLGLVITRQIVELMGGSISIESKLARGTSITFSIPLLVSQRARFFDIPHVIRGMRVLVIEESETLREHLVERLKSLSFNVTATSSCSEALFLLAEADSSGKAYPLVFISRYMAGSNTAEIIPSIKANPSLRHTPIFIIVGQRGNEHNPSHDEGMVDFILDKPFTMSQLFNAIATVFGFSADPTDRSLAVETSPGLEMPDLSGRKILLVEDNEINQQIASEILKDAGISVSVANNGEEAVFMAASDRYDAILMDIQMPVMDGFEATGRIRKDEGSVRHTPIIAMTAHAMSGDREKSIHSGMDDHLTKPVDPDELFAVLNRWITLSAAQNMASISMPDPAHRIPSIDGVDIARGLHNTGGKSERYIDHLINFYNTYRNSVQDIYQALISGEWGYIEHTAHTAKGVSANLGAQDISRIFMDIETAALSLGRERIEMNLIRLELAWKPLERFIGSEIGEYPEHHGGQIPEHCDPLASVSTLMDLLGDDDAEAVDYLNSHWKNLSSVFSSDMLQTLSDLIKSYRYNEALSYIESSGIDGLEKEVGYEQR